MANEKITEYTQVFILEFSLSFQIRSLETLQNVPSNILLGTWTFGYACYLLETIGTNESERFRSSSVPVDAELWTWFWLGVYWKTDVALPWTSGEVYSWECGGLLRNVFVFSTWQWRRHGWMDLLRFIRSDLKFYISINAV